MNAEKFFKTHSLEEISKKTKISPISLRLIRNKEFEKIPKVKFLGFIKIIQKAYNIDLNDLIEEYNTQTPQKNIQKNPQNSIPQKQKHKNSIFFIALLAFILIILGGFLLFNKLNSQKSAPIADNTPIIKKQTLTSSQIPNKPKKIIDINTSSNQKTKEINHSVKHIKKLKKENLTKKFKITIIPNKLLWFKAINIDTNKSIEYLTTHKKILPKGNYYIKFGHGDFNLTYNNQTISPNTKKVIRMLFKNGTYKFMKKPNRFKK